MNEQPFFSDHEYDHSKYANDCGHIIDELIYRSYCANRDARPDIPAERWRKVYGRWPAMLMELRYQADGMLRACGNQPTDPARCRILVTAMWEDELRAAAEWTNLGPGYGEE